MVAMIEEASSYSSNSDSAKKRIKRSDQNSSSVMSLLLLPDDLLLEVFIRLPYAKSAIQCGAVCKAWLRLISSAEFINKFQERHRNDPHVYSDPAFSLPCSISVKLERSWDGLIDSEWDEEFDCLDLTEDMLYTSRGSRRLFDDPCYLPWKASHPFIRAASGDLLLVSHQLEHCVFELCLCNPHTRQCLLLPGPVYAHNETKFSCPFGFALHPKTNDYRIAFVYPSCYEDGQLQIWIKIFNPEKGNWSRSKIATSKVSFPAPEFDLCLHDAVSSASGILYFLATSIEEEGMRNGNITGMFAIDPFRVDGADQEHCCRLIPMPDGFGQPTKRDLRLAVVRGRLRMAITAHDNENGDRGSLNVRVWELRYSNDDECDHDAFAWWILVHSFSVAEHVIVAGLHPNDGDVIFAVVRGNNEICGYHIGQRKYHKIGEIPDVPGPKFVKEDLSSYLNVLTLLHSSPPSWPAPPLPTFSTPTLV